MKFNIFSAIYLFINIVPINGTIKTKCIGDFTMCDILTYKSTNYIIINYLYNISICDNIYYTNIYKNTIYTRLKVKTKHLTYNQINQLCTLNNITYLEYFNYTIIFNNNNTINELQCILFILILIMLMLCIICINKRPFNINTTNNKKHILLK